MLFSAVNRFFCSSRKKYLIETSELQSLLNNSSTAHTVKLVNSTFYSKNYPSSGFQYIQEFYLTADTAYFDLNEVRDPDSELPYMLPSTEVFTDHMKRLKIPKDMPHIVCYDNSGVHASPRVAWMLRYFGAKNVRVLNGGLHKWCSEGNPIQQGPFQEGQVEYQNYEYQATDSIHAVADLDQVRKVAYYLVNKATDMQILDSRTKEEFYCKVPQQNDRVRPGHISGSKNIPYPDLIDKKLHCLKTDKELAKLFLAKDVDTTVTTINTSSCGITACVLDLGLKCLGAEKSLVYDGSWAEYGAVEEPDFTHGAKRGWEEPVPETFQRFMSFQSPEENVRVQGQVEFMTKMRDKERTIRTAAEKITPYKDPQYIDTEDESESDYEIENDDLYPEKK